MGSDWLYLNMGTIAKIGGFAALCLIGILVLLRKRKGRKLAKTAERSKKRIQG